MILLSCNTDLAPDGEELVTLAKQNSEFKTTAMKKPEFKAGSKSCSLSKQDSYIMTSVGITIPPSHSNAEDNSIEALEPYTIIIDPFIGNVYENNKKEMRVKNINQLSKFCDATLNRVLKKVEEVLLAERHGFKEPPLTEEHEEVMGFFEENIKERLKLKRQMRRCESYIGGRPLLQLRDRLLQDTQAPSTTLQAGGSATECSKSRARCGRRKRYSKQIHSLTGKGETFIGPLIKEAHHDIQNHSKLPSSKSKDLNLHQPSGVIGDKRADHQLNRVVASSVTQPIHTDSIIIHSKPASGVEALASITVGVDPRKYAHKDLVPQQQSIDKGTKINLTDQNIAGTFSKDPVAIEAEAGFLKAQPSYPNIQYLTELLVNSLKLEFENLVNGQDLDATIPIELKVFPTKMDKVTKSLGALKDYVEQKEVPTELKGILERLIKFNDSILALTTRVANLKGFKLDIPADLLALPASYIAEPSGGPSTGQVVTLLVEVEKTTKVDERPINQPTVLQLFQRRQQK
ncbi:hypothetical protein Tco_0205378 [Tanacetum coccineum]